MILAIVLALSTTFIPTTAIRNKYYIATQDTRECGSPTCGGFFLRQLNVQKGTKCANGETSESCYVGEFNFEKLGLSEEDESELRRTVGNGGIVFGKYDPDAYAEDGFDDIASLILKSGGWLPFQPQGSDCECEAAEVCIDDPDDGCVGCGCPTVCRSSEPEFCEVDSNCPEGLLCVDDGFCTFSPLVNCDIVEGCTKVVDCPEPCGTKIGESCGGFMRIPCAPGLLCVDPLGDGCDAACDDGVCTGMCVQDPSVILE